MARRSPARTDPDAHPTLRLTTNLASVWRAGRPAPAPAQKRVTTSSSLSWSRHPAPQTYKEATQKMWQTSEAWRQWINIGHFPDHPWRAYLQRSALTPQGLTYSPTGALLAREYHLAARTPAVPQLGLPLCLGPRLDLRPVGFVHPGA